MIDFDDTICHNSGFPNFKPTKPIKGAREALIKLKKKGFKITVFTARGWPDYQLIENWMRKHKMPTRRIICGKPLGKYIIDDRNVEFNGDWKQVINKIK